MVDVLNSPETRPFRAACFPPASVRLLLPFRVRRGRLRAPPGPSTPRRGPLAAPGSHRQPRRQCRWQRFTTVLSVPAPGESVRVGGNLSASITGGGGDYAAGRAG